MKLSGPIWLMQPIPYFGEKLKGDWIVEPKIDGWRMQIIKYADGKVECWGRRLDRKPEWSSKLRFIEKATRNLPNGILLDCELYSTGGRRFIPSLFSNTGKAKPIIYVFDVIFYENTLVGDLELRVRKGIIKRLALKRPLQAVKFDLYDIKNPPLTDLKISLDLPLIKKSDGKLAKVGARPKSISKTLAKYEGILLKDLSSKYRIGKEAPLATADWRKIKWR
jgi:ATP-dependent DNA ligase